MTSNVKYEIYCIEFCRFEKFPCEIVYNIPGIKDQMTVPLHFCYIKGGDTEILFDTGFTPAATDFLETRRKAVGGFDVVGYVDPKNLLKEINVDSQRINYIILGHLHWDHVNGIRDFPNATLVIQKKEIEFVAAEAPQKKFTRSAYFPENVVEIVHRNWDGKVKVVDGDATILHGINVYLAPGHTPGTQFCSLETESGVVTLCGDAIYTYKNLDEMIPMRIASDYIAMLNSFEKIKKVSVGNEHLLIPGHDIKIFERFPRVTERILEIR